MADITIHWSGLLKVAEVSLAFGVGIVSVFALGVLAVSRIETARATGAPGGSRVAAALLAGLAFAACAAATLYGLYLLIPQFHR
jgi:hypothetical protein